MKPRTAAILTTGCRLNQSESDALRQKLLLQGVTVVESPQPADVYYVNTCTVTAGADRSSMQLVHRACRDALRLKPDAPRQTTETLRVECDADSVTRRASVVVLGCLAQRDPGRLRPIAGVNEVWSNERKQKEIEGLVPSPVRSRAILKVQDGCSRRCSYCVVSSLRGEPVSVPADTVAEQFERLRAGFGEIVLTGLNLGMYRDRDGTGLAGLLGRLLSRCDGGRIRLASIEPDTIDDALLELLSDERLCPHLHVPLQSGDDAVLAAMRRPYRTRDFQQMLARAVAARPDLAIGCDVICGFPGEDESSFERTRRFLGELPLAYLHVFSFSLRPGTEERVKRERVKQEGVKQETQRAEVGVVRERVKELRRFSEQRRQEYGARFVGTVRGAIVETGRSALTDNYLRLGVSCPAGLAPGALARFRINMESGKLYGSLC